MPALADIPVYLNPSIISRAEYGIEYGPSLDYLRIIGEKALTEIYSLIMKPGTDGVYRESTEISDYHQAKYRESTTKRWKDVKPVITSCRVKDDQPKEPKYTGWEKNGNYLYHAGTVWINSTKDNPGDAYSFVIADGNELRIVDETTKSTYPVISAPSAYTKTKKITYLKAVVQTMIDDPENIKPYIGDNANIGHNQVCIMESVKA